MQIEPSASEEIVKRLRRVEGQVGGIIRMLEQGRDCTDIVTQFAAVNRALHRAAFKLVSCGMQQCLDPGKGDSISVDQMERLFLTLA
jgi:DNA-binding FrmR family transcriptional regulator